VFVVGYLGDWKPPAEILFESESLSGNTEKGRKARQEAAGESVPSVANCIQTTCNDYSRADGFNMIAVGAFGKNIADTVTAKFAKGAELLQQGAQNGGNCVLQPIHCVDTFPTLLSSTAGVSRPGNAVTEHQTYIAFGWQNSSHQGMSVDTISPTLDKSKTPATMQNMAVRRLTPVECERLQGFPDNYTNIPKAADGNRYKALGNSMAVPVMRWIGERINQYEQRGVEKHL
jgi:DNA (cytosine-5)-methyltransferase 1